MDRSRRRFWILAALLVAAPVVAAAAFAARFLIDRPVTYLNIEDHFKYGSTGGYRNLGFPYWIWKAMPVVFQHHLPKRLPYRPGREYEAFGFIYEEGHDLPVGWQKGRSLGIDRVFLNCAACHHSTVRKSEAVDRHDRDQALLVLGMPSARVDLGAFQQFLFDIGGDDKFTPDNIIPEIERQMEKSGAGRLGLFDRYVLYPIAIGAMQQRLVYLRQRLGLTRPHLMGPGRDDTFNPEKGQWGWLDRVPERELNAFADFPSIWNQAKKKGMKLHWDGNNFDVRERNRNAAFGTGANPRVLDLAAIRRIQDWNEGLAPPKFTKLFTIDQAKAAQGKPLYEKYCAACHGASGEDFTGAWVGTVEPIECIETDRHRLDSFTYDLAVNLGTPYAGNEELRFKAFRKTYGYANLPLDGIWLRAPYLHNGSVPTLWDLLNPPCAAPAPAEVPRQRDCRPAVFYRGNDVYDPEYVGFVSENEHGRLDGETFFKFDTTLPGNSNAGHEYALYLGRDQKMALIEYLKGF